MTITKKFIAITTAIVLGATVLEAHAEEQATCETISELAEVIMENRQHGVSMARAMGASEGSELVETIVIQAYEHPGYTTAEYQNRAVSEFTDEWYLACVKARR